MKQTAIAQRLWVLDLAFAEISPRRQLPYHEHTVNRSRYAHCGFVDGHCAGQFGGVPNLAVIVRQHVPKAAQCHRRNVNAQLRQIAVKESLRKGAAMRTIGSGSPCRKGKSARAASDACIWPVGRQGETLPMERSPNVRRGIRRLLTNPAGTAENQDRAAAPTVGEPEARK